MKLYSSSAWRWAAIGLSVSVLSLLLLTTCNRRQDQVSQTNPVSETPNATSGKAMLADALYVCPMHAHIQTHGPGKCPICGMTLVKKVSTAMSDTSMSEQQNKDPGNASDAPTVERILYYYDPMRPEVHFDKPGPSPFMDMPLIPKYASAEARTASGIRVDAAIMQSLGIRTASPIYQDVRPSFRVPARVLADARGQTRLQARVSGWVERLHVRAVGQHVSSGMIIADIYSPELIQAQEELLLGPETVGPAMERLRRLGIADTDIQAIQHAGKVSRRLPIRASSGGVVTDIGVREGSSINPDTVILDVSAEHALWIEAQLFPVQRLRLGNTLRARFSLPGWPGHEWLSEQSTPVPLVDPTTQTLSVRFSISKGDTLPLGTVLDGVIEGVPRSNVLLLPASAVIRTAQGDRVVVQRGENRFNSVPVTIGQRYGSDLEIVEGITDRDRVVISGQFLLDAEANLQSGLNSMEIDDRAPQSEMKRMQP
jgi:Cu(I)/Ag(I) efflux system membrane fusion protein